MLHENYSYIFLENFPREFSLYSIGNIIIHKSWSYYVIQHDAWNLVILETTLIEYHFLFKAVYVVQSNQSTNKISKIVYTLVWISVN